MNSWYNIRHKGKIALLLFVLICLELLNTVSHKNNISEMGEACSSVYADRLVAQDYLYKLEGLIYHRKMAIAKSIESHASDPVIGDLDRHSRDLIAAYEKTKLTTHEQELLNQLKMQLQALSGLETRLMALTGSDNNPTLLKQYETQTDALLKSLHALSEIQLAEGRQLTDTSMKLVQFSTVQNQFNWALIIIIGLVLQGLVFTSKSTLPRLPQNEQLN